MTNETTKIADSRMKPQFEFGSCWEIETATGETYFIPETVQHYPGGSSSSGYDNGDAYDGETIKRDFAMTFQPYVDGGIVDAELHENVVCWRLSAPGYKDSTDWVMTYTLYDAIDELIERYDEFNLRDILETHTEIDVDSVVEHYFIAMAFTGHRTTPSTNLETDDCEDSDKQLVSNPGGDIRDVIDGDGVREWFDGDTIDELTETVIGFTLEACKAIGNMMRDAGKSPDWESEIDWEAMGTDFHFTRNGHGAGFWDGAWKSEFDDTEFDFGDVLSELSRPYGTCEIECHGWHIDDDELQDNYHGTDADLETSLFEYGLIWSNETDSDGAIRFRYPIGYDNPDAGTVPTHFSWACLKPCEHSETGFRTKFNWVNWDAMFAAMDCTGFDQWLECGEFGMLVADIVRHYGTENVFDQWLECGEFGMLVAGSDYSHGNRIHTDDHMRCETPM